jgi:hypothetical protein
MHKITLKDMPGLDLGDTRRNRRFIKIIDNIISQPGSSIPKQNENWYDTKATYEFFKSEHVTIDKLQKAIHNYGSNCVTESEVLIIHDSCNISYNDSSADGLGYLDNKEGRGILSHNSIVATTSGLPLALLYQQFWIRAEEELGKSKERKTKPFEQKETYKWFKGIEQTNGLLDKAIKKIHVGDREADIYELFFMKPEDNSELLVRARQNRKTAAGSSLWQQIGSLPVAEVITLNVPDATGKKKREATVEVRYEKVEILRPSGKDHEYKSVELTAIEIREPGIDDEEDGIWWKLLTTLEIKNIEDVKQCILWYTYRWLIERFHYVLKSGCKVEELQLQTAESLQKAIATYSIAAFKIMQMVYQSRETPNVSCEVVLMKEEWQTLYMVHHKINKLPEQPPTLREAIAWIGRLGGHLGRKSDGPPGLKTVWRGYQRLMDFVKMYTVLQQDKFG